jgi:hypothetical protein
MAQTTSFEYRPRRGTVVITLAVLSAFVSGCLLVEIGQARDMIVTATRGNDIQFGGLGVPEGVEGATVSLRSEQASSAGVVVESVDVPDGSGAKIVTAQLQEPLSPPPADYTEIVVEFPPRSIAQSLYDAMVAK